MTLPRVNPTTAQGNTVNRIIKHSQENTIAGNRDIIVNKSPGGMSLSLASKHKNNRSIWSNYVGKWNSTDSYSIGDIARVETETESSSSKGVWICVADVPNKDASDYYKQQGWSEGLPEVRVTGINYYPIWPEPTRTSADVLPTDNPVQAANIRYWELLSLLPTTMHICINGVDEILYVDAARSGSATI